MGETVGVEVNRNLRQEEADNVPEAKSSQAGFKQLYARWLSPVYRYFYFRTGSAADAEDLTSQVFLKVYEELPRYNDRGRFSAWLFTIARNQANDFFRKRNPEVPVDLADPADGSLDMLSQAVRSDEIQRLNRLIRTLPDGEQELIRLRFAADLSYREIGDLLHKKEDAVRKSISRLLVRLQAQMEAHDE